ncbi:MAG: hypothetical protein ACRD2A_16830, partial [Vicinamibacterales bacterium]
MRSSRPGGVVVSSDTNPEELAFVAAARTVAIPSVFIAHGYPTPIAPPLDFSLSILEGGAALDARQRKGPIKGEVFLVGLGGESAPLDLTRFEKPDSVIGVFAPKVVVWETLAEVIRDCRQRLGAKRVLIRWHPSMLEPPQLQRVLADATHVVETSPSETLQAVATQCDWIVADLNSNVHLAVLKLGVPTVAIRNLGTVTDCRSDIYGFESERIVLHVSSVNELSSQALAAFYSSDWRQRFAHYDASYLRPAGDIEREAREAILRVMDRDTRAMSTSDERIGSQTPTRVASEPGSPKSGKSKLLGLAVSTVVLMLLYQRLDIGAIGGVLANANVPFLVVSLGMIAPITMIRATRFAWLAPPGSVAGLG